MAIETKQILALIILVELGAAGFLATLISQRLRDVALFVLAFGAVLVQRMDVTLLGQYWYRGTSRGIEFSALDIVPALLLGATLLLPRYPRDRFYWPASFGLLVLYFLYCAGSVLGAEPQFYGVWELVKVVRGLMVFLAAALFIRTRRELMIVVLALTCVVWMEAANALEQRFVKGIFRTPGTFDHENTLSTYLCTVGPVLMAAAMANWPKWLRWFAGLGCLLAAATELLTLSRLGIPVFVLVMTSTAVACTSWKLSLRKAAVVTAAVVCMLGLVTVSWDGLKVRYLQTNIAREFLDERAVETRGVYWRLAFAILDDHPYGVGLNNWPYYVGKTYGPELGYRYTDYDDLTWALDEEDVRQTFLAPAADSLPALTLGELGVVGALLLALVWFRWFGMGVGFLRDRLNPDPVHRMAIGFLFGAVGISLQSLTEWTYRQTPVLFTFHLTMGALASLHHLRRRRARRTKEVPAGGDEAGGAAAAGTEPVSAPIARGGK